MIKSKLKDTHIVVYNHLGQLLIYVFSKIHP